MLSLFIEFYYNGLKRHSNWYFCNWM